MQTINAEQYITVNYSWKEGAATRAGVVILVPSSGFDADTLADIFEAGLAAYKEAPGSVTATQVVESAARPRRRLIKPAGN